MSNTPKYVDMNGYEADLLQPAWARIVELERELAALRAKIDGAVMITISHEGNSPYLNHYVKSGETRTFKLVPVDQAEKESRK